MPSLRATDTADWVDPDRGVRNRRPSSSGPTPLLMGAARARFGLADFAGALAALDRLQAAHPGLASSEAHLIYARSLEGLGRDEEAAAEYRGLVGYAPGEEARCRYGQLLQRLGDTAGARRQFEEVVKNSRLGTARYRREQQAWVEIAERALAGS
jgi:hypothetical protein